MLRPHMKENGDVGGGGTTTTTNPTSPPSPRPTTHRELHTSLWATPHSDLGWDGDTKLETHSPKPHEWPAGPKL